MPRAQKVLFVSPGPPVCGGRGRGEEKTDWRIVTGDQKRDNDENDGSRTKTTDFGGVSRKGPGVTKKEFSL